MKPYQPQRQGGMLASRSRASMCASLNGYNWLQTLPLIFVP